MYVRSLKNETVVKLEKGDNLILHIKFYIPECVRACASGAVLPSKLSVSFRVGTGSFVICGSDYYNIIIL